ncbi:metal-dependent transcriptional regulator [Candidatus Sumerlaeota bacterium]|nr:metal-dependent transcriptional regulator [Candidatus Sumerlaeota bacterium]
MQNNSSHNKSHKEDSIVNAFLDTKSSEGRNHGSKKDHQEIPQELGSYVLLIQDLLNEKGYVRGVELAERLGMSRPTVTRAMQRLAQLGYANYERYRGITLTPAGAKAAEASRKRYRIIADFLAVCGYKMADQQLEARRLESYCSDEILSALRAAGAKLSA